jgi:hypothetical protein
MYRLMYFVREELDRGGFKVKSYETVTAAALALVALRQKGGKGVILDETHTPLSEAQMMALITKEAAS